MRDPLLPVTTYRRRRRAAARSLAAAHGGPVPLLVIGAPEPAAGDLPIVVGKARQDPWFEWLCGCREPDAALLIDGRGRATLFLEPGDPSRVIWEGPRRAPDAASRRHYGVDAVADRSALLERVTAAAALADGRVAMLWRKQEPGFQSGQVPGWRRRLRGLALLNGEPALLPLRMSKDADELAWHRRAVRATAAGYRQVMAGLPSMATEAEVAGELARCYLRSGHEAPAFASIVGGGVNAATLHYPHNDQPLPRRGPVLIDSGARAGGYCADVTRTLPRHGRFDDRRLRELYEIVLRAQALGIKHARPGISMIEWNELAWALIIDAG
ncbi:MAG: aminopeptidase P N-terminal domain-containing protein, partial [Planctomycetota bacterium]